MRPVLFSLFGVPFPSYYTLLIVGFMLVTGIAWFDAKRLNVNRDDLIDMSIWMLFSGFVGARLLHVFADGYFMDYVHLCTDPLQVEVPSFIHVACTSDADCVAADAGELCGGGHCHPGRDCLAAFKFWQGGLAFYGGLILALFVAIWFMRRRQMVLRKVMDLTAAPIAWGLVFGRTGCLLAGCCFGAIAPNHAPSIEFSGYVTEVAADGSCKPHYDLITTENGEKVCAIGRPAFIRHVKENRLPMHAKHSLPVHPTQVYEAAFCFLIGCYLFFWRRKRVKFQGQAFWEFSMLYGIGRFVVEFFRDDDRGLWFLNLSTSQLIAIPLIVLGLVMIIRGGPPVDEHEDLKPT